MSFAGVSVVAAESAKIYAGSSAAGSGSWYHLLVVEGYSRIKDLPTGQFIKGCSFRAGGYRWALRFYPNGEHPHDAGFVSVYLVLDQDDVARPVKVHLHFSFTHEVYQQDPAFIRAIHEVYFSRHVFIWGQRRVIKVEDLEKSEHLKDDCFTIRCDFIIAEAATAPLIEVPPAKLRYLNHLFLTKMGADVMFEVGHETFTAHRCVLASRSPVFMAEFFGPMKEGSSTAGAIQIQDMEPNVFKAMLAFIYTDLMPKMESEGEAEQEEGGDTDLMLEMESEGESEEEQEGGAGAQVVWLQRLLAAADRYDLPRLKSLCEKSLSGHIHLSSVLSITNLAAQHHCRGLKEACLEFLKAQSAEDLQGVMATSDWQHIAATNLSIVNELITKLASKA